MRLNMFGLPKIQSVDDFSRATHLSKNSIYKLSKHSSQYYFKYTIKKKTGKERIISQPSKNLKGLQAWILVNILNKLKVSISCKGFEKGTSILDNAIPHRNADCILTIDLADFYDTITSIQVYNVFRVVGYNKLISTILTNICTCDGYLPQGSPCSPKLANLILWKLDIRIQGFVGKKGITYTRYADDLSFSGVHSKSLTKIIPIVKSIIEDEGFFINNTKTRLSGKSRANIVTGLIISNQKIGIGAKKYKTIRSKVYQLTQQNNQKNNTLKNEVKGWIAYIKSVDQTRYNKLLKYIKTLKDQHPTTLIQRLTISQ